MAEFCKKCFIEKLTFGEIKEEQIIESNDYDLCEGCGEIKHIVLYVKEEKK